MKSFTTLFAVLCVCSLSACLDEPQPQMKNGVTSCQQQTLFMQSVLSKAEIEAGKIAQKLGMDKDKVDYNSLVSISYEVTGRQDYEIKTEGNYVYVKIELPQDGCLRHKGGGNELIEK